MSENARLRELLADSVSALDSGRCEQGKALSQEAITLSGRLGDRRAEATALVLLARHLSRSGDNETCSQVCDQAAQALKALGDEAGLGEILVVQALALNELGLHEEALDSLAVARGVAARLNDRPLLFWVLNRIAVVHSGMQDFARAKEFQLRALELAAGLDVDARFCIVNNIADNSIGLYRQLAERGEQGDPDENAAALRDGLEYARKAVELSQHPTHGTPYRQSLAWDNHGMLLALAGHTEEGLAAIQHAQRIAVEHGFQAMELSTIYHSAFVLLERGDAEQAVDELTVALRRATEMGELPTRMEIALELSRALESTGRFEAALQRYKEYTAVERQLRSAVGATRARRLEQLVEVDNARLDAADARTESQLYRERSRELESEIQALEMLAADLDRRANEDALTRLSNRHHIETELPRLIEAAGSGRPLGLAVLDIDHFKHVNDTWGHSAGDEVLVAVAALLRRSSRAGDLAGRFGGEEFLLALPGLGEQAAFEVCQRVRRSVQDYDWSSIRPGLRVTISIGLCALEPGDDPRELIERADERLYRAKRSGRNRVEAFPGGMGQEAS